MSSDEWSYRDDLMGLAEMMVAADDGSALSTPKGEVSLDELRIWLHDTASTENEITKGEDSNGRVQEYLDDVVAGVPTSSRPNDKLLAEELESRKLILDGIATLPANYRVALVLKDGAHLTVERISDRLGTTEASVRSVLYRARRSLRERSGA